MLRRLVLSGVAGVVAQVVVFVMLYPLVFVTSSDLAFVAFVLLLPGLALASIEGSEVSLAAALSINLLIYAPLCFVVLHLVERRRRKNGLKKMLGVSSDAELLSIAAWRKARSPEGAFASRHKGI